MTGNDIKTICLPLVEKEYEQIDKHIKRKYLIVLALKGLIK
jgi:hypothetical protein